MNRPLGPQDALSEPAVQGDEALPTDSPEAAPPPSASARNPWRARVMALIKIAVAIGLMAYLLGSGRISFARVERALDRWDLLVASFACFALPTIINTFRWQMLLKAAGFSVTWWRCFELNHIGNFFNNFSLGSVGGDLIKAYYVVKSSPQARARSAITVFVDRFIGLIALIFIGCLAALPLIDRARESAEFKVLILSIFALLLSMVAGGCAVVSRRLRRWSLLQKVLARLPGPVQKLEGAARAYRQHLGSLLVSLAISLLTHTSSIAGCVLIAWSLGIELSISEFAFIVPMGLFLNALPLSFGNWGTGEYAWEKLFDFAGIHLGDHTGGDLCLLLHILNLIWNLTGVVFYLTYKHRNIDFSEQDSGPQLGKAP